MGFLAIARDVLNAMRRKWLESFAYRINLNWWIFTLAGLISIVVSVLTVFGAGGSKNLHVMI